MQTSKAQTAPDSKNSTFPWTKKHAKYITEHKTELSPLDTEQTSKEKEYGITVGVILLNTRHAKEKIRYFSTERYV